MSSFKQPDIVPGLMVEVRGDRPLTTGVSLPGGGGYATVPYVAVREFNGVGQSFPLKAGDVCEVVKKPRKSHGVNLVEVKNPATGQQGFVFWCEFKVNMVLPSPTPSSKMKL